MRVRKGKRPQEDVIEHGYDCGSGSKAQRQDSDGEGSLVGVAYDSPKCCSEILPEFDTRLTPGVVVEPALVFAIASMSPSIDVAKGVSRLGMGLRLGETRGDPFVSASEVVVLQQC